MLRSRVAARRLSSLSFPSLRPTAFSAVVFKSPVSYDEDPKSTPFLDSFIFEDQKLAFNFRASVFLQVQTRATTLPKYISSSEDILSHAKKLLKAELPASLRLLGLRVSQFSEDKVGPSDPMQKPITNFVVVGDTSTPNNDSSRLKAKDSCFPNGIGDDFATCDHNSAYIHKDVFNNDQLLDFCPSSCTMNDNTSMWNRAMCLLILFKQKREGYWP